jgi:hypothetical protein
VSDAVWPRLAAPFGGDAVVWVPVEVADSGDEVRVVPLLAPEALRERLDRTVEIGGWGVAYAPLDAGAVACHVTLAGVTKGAVAAPALLGGGAATAAVAFARAAELFGLRAPFPSGASAWVPCDPDTLAPLHPPEVDEASAAAPSELAGLDSAPASAAPASAAPTRARSGAADGAAIALAPAVAAAAAATVPAVAPPAPEKPTGQQMIDRLVDRLKDEGQGLAAARLLVRYGGYGKDPDTARELYARLRALLRGEAVAAGDASRGGAT